MQLNKSSKQSGYALLIVMAFTLLWTMLIISAVMNWTSNNSTLTARNTQLQNSYYAADSAIEKALGSMEYDYFRQSVGTLSSYASSLPSSSDSAFFQGVLFSDGTTTGQIFISNTVPNLRQTNTTAAYSGLVQTGSKYQIIANAKYTNTSYTLTGTVGQEVSLLVTPLFQFAIFYQNEMEIEPGANMVVNGPVHANGNTFLLPNNSTLTFSNAVTASGSITLGQDPNDPSSRTYGTLQASNGLYSGVPPLTLPVGLDPTMAATNSSASINSNIIGILDIPPTGESPNSTTGTNRFYNKADLIILVSNDVVQVSPGIGNPYGTNLSSSIWTNFINTNISLLNTNNNYTNFHNGREGASVQVVDINVGKLSQMAFSNLLGNITNVQTVYIADERATNRAVVSSNTVAVTSLTVPSPGNYTGGITTNSTGLLTNSPPPAPNIPPALNVVSNTASATASNYPTAGTYTGPVTTNTTSVTGASLPSPGTYVGAITTNTVVNGASYPSQFIPGTLTTNTTLISNASSAPAPGTYVGTVTSSGHPTRYTYNKITGYTYTTGYTYNVRTGTYTYNLITDYTYNLPTYTYNVWVFTTNLLTVEPGVRLTNGAALSTNLTIASPDPVYISGNYNVTRNGTTQLNSNNTTYTYAAAVIADAVTILSTAWKDTGSYGVATAANTTVNAAFLSGNVPTVSGSYSGGVENFPRFLENWSGGVTFTYNGSMVCMFNSRYATAKWAGSYYNPPTRKWAFDTNFLDPNKLPPSTPKALSIYRSRWATLAPNTTSF